MRGVSFATGRMSGGAEVWTATTGATTARSGSGAHAAYTVYDTLDQVAPVLVPHAPPDELRLIDFADYRRNPFLGPPGLSQPEWLQACAQPLMEALSLQPPSFNLLLDDVAKISEGGRIATVPRVSEWLDSTAKRSSAASSLQNRLCSLQVGTEAFSCE